MARFGAAVPQGMDVKLTSKHLIVIVAAAAALLIGGAAHAPAPLTGGSFENPDIGANG